MLQKYGILCVSQSVSVYGIRRIFRNTYYSFNQAQAVCAAQGATLHPTYSGYMEELSTDVLQKYYEDTMKTNISLWINDPTPTHPGMCAWQNTANERNTDGIYVWEEQWGVKFRDCDDSGGSEKIGFICKIDKCDRFNDWADMGTGVKFASPAVDTYGNEILNQFTSIFRAQIVCVGLLTGCSGVHGRYVKDQNWGYPIYQLGRGNIIPSDDHESTFSRPENPCSHYEDDGCPVGADSHEAGSDTGGVLISSTLSVFGPKLYFSRKAARPITNANLKFSNRAVELQT